MVAIQALDGISAMVFGLMLPLIAADLTRRTGFLNLAIGSLGLAAGLGAMFSTTAAGWIADRSGCRRPSWTGARRQPGRAAAADRHAGNPPGRRPAARRSGAGLTARPLAVARRLTPDAGTNVEETARPMSDTASHLHRADGDYQCLHEFIPAARAKLSDHIWDYLVGATETETTMRRNRLALDSLALRPRVCRDVSQIDTSTTLFGRKLRMPVMLAPVGSLESLRPRRRRDGRTRPRRSSACRSSSAR